MRESVLTVKDCAYGKTITVDPEPDKARDLFYTIEKDEGLNLVYRVYHVSTADQLATILSNYKGSMVNLTSNAFLGTATAGDQKFIIKHLTFNTVNIGRIGGMFGSAVKKCTVKDSYVKGAGHSGLFSSYNTNAIAPTTASYVGDTTPAVKAYYFQDVPSVDAMTRLWHKNSAIIDGEQITMTPNYPAIYEDSSTIDSGVYDGFNHSGTFISCAQNNIIFRNCYSNATICGTEVTSSPGKVANLSNCYYDRQTTAMRERGVGGKGTIIWDNSDPQYYPQLKSHTVMPATPTDPTDKAARMLYERDLMGYYSSLASTSTVFLDHYDEILDIDGEIKECDDPLVYDTVRDITRRFVMTTNGDVAWQTNTLDRRNETNGFVNRLGGEDGGEKISKYDKKFNPKILTIGRNYSNIYECLDFAPGKQWVTAVASELPATQDEYCTITNPSGLGTHSAREFRLLPTAYLDAGEIVEIGILESEGDREVKNEVRFSLILAIR